MDKKNNNYNFNSIDLLIYIWNKKGILILISGIAFIASIIISLSITPMFKSKVVLFPAASVSISKTLLATTALSTEVRDVLSFGEEEEAERMLQILNSDFIRWKIIDKHNLMEHYDIDPESKYPFTQLYSQYTSNISAQRTQYMSIEIEVLDKDPEMAATIANDIAGLIDSTMFVMQQQRATEAFKLVEREYKKVQHEISELNDSLRQLGQLGVIDYESQSAVLNEAYANALIDNNTRALNRINNKLDLLSKYGGNYLAIKRILEKQTEYLSNLQAKYAQAKINKEQKLPQVFIVDQAYAAEKKAKPKRSIIVIVSTISAFFLGLLTLLVVDSVKKRI
ncbi:MAG: hypothetical protein GVY19_01040 [Bacteroidetes bacterium]|jgi:uncharacterized protein involved in exopolysaccharide biosynthesis|nr:hypothetical protein [Bacteroidota bacterium]